MAFDPNSLDDLLQAAAIALGAGLFAYIVGRAHGWSAANMSLGEDYAPPEVELDNNETDDEEYISRTLREAIEEEDDDSRVHARVMRFAQESDHGYSGVMAQGNDTMNFIFSREDIQTETQVGMLEQLLASSKDSGEVLRFDGYYDGSVFQVNFVSGRLDGKKVIIG
ncbi:MAG: hypothetical protein HY438_01000 [DPANN group archaeon]|nr:hypothetical protein [DPANN group archaeon]